MRYSFLSVEWIAAMRELRAEYAAQEEHATALAAGSVERSLVLVANVTVTGPPFGDGPIRGHIDTSGPALTIEEGHLDAPDFGIELPYDLAKQLFVDRDPAQVMPALLGGAVKLTGDSSKVLALAGLLAPPPSAAQAGSADDPVDGPAPDLLRELVRRIDEITEP